MVFLWFSYGFPRVFLWFSYGFPMVFLWFSYGFPRVFLWFSYGFPTVSHPFPALTCPNFQQRSDAPGREENRQIPRHRLTCFPCLTVGFMGRYMYVYIYMYILCILYNIIYIYSVYNIYI